METNSITARSRGMMKVYAARDYVDNNYRRTNYVEVNLPEFMPTTPLDNAVVDLNLDQNYFCNKNFPKTEDSIKISHYLTLPLHQGTNTPVRFHKGAEFLLLYPTGKIEDGFMIYLKDSV